MCPGTGKLRMLGNGHPRTTIAQLYNIIYIYIYLLLLLLLVFSGQFNLFCQGLHMVRYVQSKGQSWRHISFWIHWRQLGNWAVGIDWQKHFRLCLPPAVAVQLCQRKKRHAKTQWLVKSSSENPSELSGPGSDWHEGLSGHRFERQGSKLLKHA